MKRSINGDRVRSAVLMILMLCGGCATDNTANPRYDWGKAAFLDTEYALVRSGKDIPQFIIEALYCLTLEKHTAFANPGEKFQATDVAETPLPQRQLILAGKSNKSWFLCYDKGGMASHQCLVVMSIDEDKQVARVIWTGMCNTYPPCIDSFVDGISLETLKQLVKDGSIEKSEYDEWPGNF